MYNFKGTLRNQDYESQSGSNVKFKKKSKSGAYTYLGEVNTSDLGVYKSDIEFEEDSDYQILITSPDGSVYTKNVPWNQRGSL